MIDKIKHTLEVLILCIILVTISMYMGMKLKGYEIEKLELSYEYKLDSMKVLVIKYKLSDSLIRSVYNKSFNLHKDSVTIDNRGYFKSKYHKTYKYTKN